MITSGMRHPKTTSERRASADPDIKDLVRAKRNHKNIPNSWDDIQVGRSGRKPKYKDHKV